MRLDGLGLGRSLGALCVGLCKGLCENLKGERSEGLGKGCRRPRLLPGGIPVTLCPVRHGPCVLPQPVPTPVSHSPGSCRRVRHLPSRSQETGTVVSPPPDGTPGGWMWGVPGRDGGQRGRPQPLALRPFRRRRCWTAPPVAPPPGTAPPGPVSPPAPTGVTSTRYRIPSRCHPPFRRVPPSEQM